MEKECMQPGCYLLIILAEPICEDHKERILQRVAKGLLSWDPIKSECDLKEVENVIQNIRRKKDFKISEILLQHSTEKLALEVLLNPQIFTLKQCLKNLLLSPTGHKHIIHAGYSFTGTGSWMLDDGVFGFQDFVDAFQDNSVQNFLRSYPEGLFTLDLHCAPIGQWIVNDLQKLSFSKFVKVELNPSDSSSGVQGAAALLDFFDESLKHLNLESQMTPTEIVGNIRFNRPTLYIFPSGQGDCSLFGITGFTMLIDGGFTPIPSFWNFIRHLERLDAIMVTRLNEDNLWGMSSLFKKKILQPVYPQIGYIFCNISEGKPNIDKKQNYSNELLVSVIDVGQEFLGNLKQVGLNPLQCLREPFASIEPMTLYHKVGHGTLDMYILSPPRDNRILKDFLNHWNTRKESFSLVRTGSASQKGSDVAIPLSNIMSICCLLVWRPHDPNDTIARMLFPGSAPQSRIFEGLDKIQKLDILQHQTCTKASIKINTSSVNISTKDEKSNKFSRFRSASPVSRTKPVYEKQQSIEIEKGDSSDASSSPIQKRIKPQQLPLKKSTTKNVSKEVTQKITQTAKTEKQIPKSDKSIVNRSLSQSPKKRISKETQLKNGKTKETKKPIKGSKKEIDNISTKTDETDEEILKITLTMNGYDHKNNLNGVKSENIIEIVNEKRKALEIDNIEVQNKFLHSEYLKDEIEPDSLDSGEHEGRGEISKDSLEVSEDEIAVDRSLSKIQNVINIEEGKGQDVKDGEVEDLEDVRDGGKKSFSEETKTSIEMIPTQSQDNVKEFLKEDSADKSQVTSLSTLSPMSNTSFPDSQLDNLPEKIPLQEKEKLSNIQTHVEPVDSSTDHIIESMETDIVTNKIDSYDRKESIPSENLERESKSDDSLQLSDKTVIEVTKSDESIKISDNLNETLIPTSYVDIHSNDSSLEFSETKIVSEIIEDDNNKKVDSFDSNICLKSEELLPDSIEKEPQSEKTLESESNATALENEPSVEFSNVDAKQTTESSTLPPKESNLNFVSNEKITEYETNIESSENLNALSKKAESKAFESVPDSSKSEVELREIEDKIEIEKQIEIESTQMEKDSNDMKSESLESSQNNLEIDLNTNRIIKEESKSETSELTVKKETKEVTSHLSGTEISENDKKLEERSQKSAPDSDSKSIGSETNLNFEKTNDSLDEKRVEKIIVKDVLMNELSQSKDIKQQISESDKSYEKLIDSQEGNDLKTQSETQENESKIKMSANELDLNNQIDTQLIAQKSATLEIKSEMDSKTLEPTKLEEIKGLDNIQKSSISEIKSEKTDIEINISIDKDLKIDEKSEDSIISVKDKQIEISRDICLEEKQMNVVSDSELKILGKTELKEDIDDKKTTNLENLVSNDAEQQDISSKQIEKESDSTLDETKIELKETELKSFETESKGEFSQNFENLKSKQTQMDVSDDEKSLKGDIQCISTTDNKLDLPEISTTELSSKPDTKYSIDEKVIDKYPKASSQSSELIQESVQSIKSDKNTDFGDKLTKSEPQLKDENQALVQTLDESKIVTDLQSKINYEELPLPEPSPSSPKIIVSENKEQEFEDFSTKSLEVQKIEMKDNSVKPKSEKVIEDFSSKSSIPGKIETDDSSNKLKSEKQVVEDFLSQKPSIEQKPTDYSIKSVCYGGDTEESELSASSQIELKDSVTKSDTSEEGNKDSSQMFYEQEVNEFHEIRRKEELKEQNIKTNELTPTVSQSQALENPFTDETSSHISKEKITGIQTLESDKNELNISDKMISSENKDLRIQKESTLSDSNEFETNKRIAKIDSLSDVESDNLSTVIPKNFEDKSVVRTEVLEKNLQEVSEDVLFTSIKEAKSSDSWPESSVMYSVVDDSNDKNQFTDKLSAQKLEEYAFSTDEANIETEFQKVKPIDSTQQIEDDSTVISKMFDRQSIESSEVKNISIKTDPKKTETIETKSSKERQDYDNLTADENNKIDASKKRISSERETQEVIKSSSISDSQKSNQSLTCIDKIDDLFKSDDEKDRDFPEMSVTMTTSHLKEKPETNAQNLHQREKGIEIVVKSETNGKQTIDNFDPNFNKIESKEKSNLPLKGETTEKLTDLSEFSIKFSESSPKKSTEFDSSVDVKQEGFEFQTASTDFENIYYENTESEFDNQKLISISKSTKDLISSENKLNETEVDSDKYNKKETVKSSEGKPNLELVEMKAETSKTVMQNIITQSKEEEEETEFIDKTMSSKKLNTETDKNKIEMRGPFDLGTHETSQLNISSNISKIGDKFSVQSEDICIKPTSDEVKHTAEFSACDQNYEESKNQLKSDTIAKSECNIIGTKENKKVETHTFGDETEDHSFQKLSSEMIDPIGSHNLPLTYIRGSSQIVEQPLYEDSDEDDNAINASNKIMQHSIHSTTLSRDYPELITMSGGTTPSQSAPQSPYDSKSISRSESLRRKDKSASISTISEDYDLEKVNKSYDDNKTEDNKSSEKTTEESKIDPTIMELKSKDNSERDNVIEFGTEYQKKTSEYESDSRRESVSDFKKDSIEETIASSSSEKQLSQQTTQISDTIKSSNDKTSEKESKANEKSKETLEKEIIIIESTSSSDKKFNIDNWGKPLNLPTPPEPLDSQIKSSNRVTSKKSIHISSANQLPKTKPSTFKPTKKSNETDSSGSSVYVDLAYVPHHADQHYCNSEYFQRVRARYYVFSGIDPHREVFEALIEGKKTWDKQFPTTVIPTHESEALGFWISMNQELLTQYMIDVAPAADRCTVNLQDHQTKCSAYRVEF